MARTRHVSARTAPRAIRICPTLVGRRGRGPRLWRPRPTRIKTTRARWRRPAGPGERPGRAAPAWAAVVVAGSTRIETTRARRRRPAGPGERPGRAAPAWAAVVAAGSTRIETTRARGGAR